MIVFALCGNSVGMDFEGCPKWMATRCKQASWFVPFSFPAVVAFCSMHAAVSCVSIPHIGRFSGA